MHVWVPLPAVLLCADNLPYLARCRSAVAGSRHIPRTEREEQGDRANWPWLPGTILAVCGPDEWQVCVEVRELATLEEGRLPHSNTPDHKLFYPACFRDSSDIRARGDW